MRKLNISSESGVPASYELAESVITIGRAPDNLIQLDDPSVSGRHAQLQRVGEDYELRDLDSTNGTRVNGSFVKSATLRVGDRVRFGKVEGRFESETEGGVQPLPKLQPVEARPAEVSARPVDFGNASPFAGRVVEKDPTRLAAIAVAVVAFLAFLGSLLALLQMQAPAP